MSGPEGSGGEVTGEALAEVLEELRRHLLWSEEGGGALLTTRAAPATRLAPGAAVVAEARAPAAESTGRSFKDLLPGRAAAKATPAAPPPAAAPAPGAGVAPPAALFDVAATARPAAVAGGPQPTLDSVRAELGECTRCKLCQSRKNIVFGAGNPRAELVFVGEGPGETEDLQGLPFVGAAGELLTKMIDAMGFSREQVYICNVVKCRPPGNRNPEPDEVASCEPFLRGQLAALQPKVIVALGKFAAQTLLRDATPISRLRGQWREYQGVRLMPTFHPAYLLRQPGDKKLAWSDLQQVMQALGKAPRKS